MKKICLGLCILFLMIFIPVNGTELTGSVEFEWVNMTQIQRDTTIKYYHDKLFNNNTTKTYSKKEFQKQFSKYLKDTNYKNHYKKARAGVKETENANICAFYYRKNVLIIYALQYKNNLKNIYYYDGFGKLRYVDIISEEYPSYPYTSRQYNENGKLISSIFFKSHDMQYMYEPNGEFKGLWYKAQMYDKAGKQKVTRTNWGT